MHTQFRQLPLIMLCAVALFGLHAAWASAQDPQPAAATDPVVQELGEKASLFLDRVAGDEADEAFAALLEGGQLAKRTTAVKSLIEKANQLQEKYGEYRASEQLAAARVGNDLVLIKFLFKCQYYPVVWHFTFYRNFQRTADDGDDWIVIGVRFDTQLEQLGL